MTIFLAIVSISFMLLLPVSLAILVRRRYSVPWWLFCTGIATFALSQLLHLPLNDWLSGQGLIGPVASGAEALLLTAAVLGVSAGLSETLLRVVGYWFVNRMYRRGVQGEASGARWQDGLMIGVGHGGLEAMGLVAVLMAASISSLWALQGVDLATLNLSPDTLANLELQLSQVKSSPWLLLLPSVERVLALALHVILSLLVWSSLSRRNVLFLLAAIAYHSLVDGVAVYSVRFLEQSWQVQILLFVMLIPGAIWAWRTRPEGGTSMLRSVRPAKAQLALFGSALRKELQQQWRTKRALVVVAVFLLFGLGSPLLAKYTPEMLRAVEGAEQFADLIPSPTRSDSLEQYVKNLTQFGFIIAIVLGMGSVAGEKERGTAAMILSKPIPRWAYVVSKFVSLATIYGLALLLAALGAFYYTDVLFGPLQFGPFMLGNLLLWIWLLDFAAVTLLGSVVARTSGAAAGVALIGSVVLLLSGSLPKIGSFAPSALVAWAGRLGIGASVPANGGALVASVSLIIICLVTAVALFETQEL